MIEEAEFELVEGTGNVFRDLGDPDAALKQAKAVLAADIIVALDNSGFTVRKAGELTGFAAADFSRVRNANLGRFTIDRLMRMHAALTRNLGSVIRSFVPPFLMATANDIESWADTHGSRDQLAVFLRMLVHSTCDGLEFVDFPGNDDAQRPGWDGSIETTAGNPWVPAGTSRWEFGTGYDVVRKANKDYEKRTAETDATERQRTTFVFVTPRRWRGKVSWLGDRRAEAKWLDVRAWDAGNLEQWLEQSIPAQAWFGIQGSFDMRGIKSLDKCWTEWCADCKPTFTGHVFNEAIAAFGEQICAHLRNGEDGLLRIIANSREEGLAFLHTALSRQDVNLSGFRDRVVVFTRPGPLSELAEGSPRFIPVVTSTEIEKELVQSGCAFPGVVVETPTAMRREADVTLEPLSGEAFYEALGTMNLTRERIERLERDSGRSLTVLRRQLSNSPAINSPSWSSNPEFARALFPMMLAGAWKASNEADRYLMCQLTGVGDYNDLESRFLELLHSEDPPVWFVGEYRGVVSKIDALYATRRWAISAQVSEFMTIAGIVLSDLDPALSLPIKDQWAASVYGKAREISSPLRKGIAESLVLLAVHGTARFESWQDLFAEFDAAGLVEELLEPMTKEKLQSQGSNLSLYAEAAPDRFLSIIERDLVHPGSAVAALMEPVTDAVFGRADRVHLLGALEILAWHPSWLSRVVDILARLTELEPIDNLANKPSASLGSFFRYWLPQTGATAEQRIQVLDRLATCHPKVAWEIAMSQIRPGPQTAFHNRKPRWRDYALGLSGQATDQEVRTFLSHCKEMCLVRFNHTRETLDDLVSNAQKLNSQELDQLGEVIASWAATARDEDRVWLRERIRVTRKMAICGSSNVETVSSNFEKCVRMANAAFEVLEPTDLIWKQAWLFQHGWVPESRDEIEEPVDLQSKNARVESLRLTAIKEVIAGANFDGVLRLAFTGDAPRVAGHFSAKAIVDDVQRLALLQAMLADGNLLHSRPHQDLIGGFLLEIGSTSAIQFINAVRPAFGDDVGVKLLSLCEFSRPVWSTAKDLGGSVSKSYWKQIVAGWRGHSDEDTNYAVSQLLKAGRAGAALDFARLDWGRVESELIRRILVEFPTSTDLDRYRRLLDRHTIPAAIKVLSERNAFDRGEIVRLEYLYLELFWLEPGSTPNLELEIEANPELFCEVIALAFRPDDSDETPELSENERRLAEKAHRLLGVLSRIPGHSEDGKLDSEKLEEWVRRAREICHASGHRSTGDYQIGQLLSNAPDGKDGIWPCAPVRIVLDRVLNDNIEEGFRIGRRNSRDAELRGKGGAQERKLAEQCEKWAEACDCSYPKVATALRGLASAYESEGQWWVREAAIQQRLGY